ncbi:MAG: DUF5106 domain-containing protein [Muribaculaceae bacterium]|nr:DUF5106 domain-containing protein [Muribaculaceae bacterium]
MNRIYFLSLCLLISIFSCCAGATQKSSQDNLQVAENEIETLELPKPPSTLSTPEEKADFILLHFWDGLDFSDTVRSHDIDFMEQNFSNFISIMPYADEKGVKDAVKKLYEKAGSDAKAYNIINDISEKYLYDPLSPMLNEESYLIFLEVRKEMANKNDRSLARAESQLEEVIKNRVGSKAADFEFMTIKGDKRRLSDIELADDNMLIFFDPDCETCHEVINRLRKNNRIEEGIKGGTLKIIAVYSGPDKEKWDTYASTLPASWIVGYEPGKIEDEEIYILRAMPTVYVLNKNGEVKAKDVIIDGE